MGEWRKLQNGELHNFHSPPGIIRQMKSRRMRWARHVARLEEVCTGFWRESPEEKDHLKGQGVDGRMGSKWNLGRWVVGRGVDLVGSG
jgi:hypothetical protein